MALWSIKLAPIIIKNFWNLQLSTSFAFKTQNPSPPTYMTCFFTIHINYSFHKIHFSNEKLHVIFKFEVAICDDDFKKCNKWYWIFYFVAEKKNTRENFTEKGIKVHGEKRTHLSSWVSNKMKLQWFIIYVIVLCRQSAMPFSILHILCALIFCVVMLLHVGA